jgi:hypothetical protein
VPQGVRTGIFSKGLEDFSIKLRRFSTLKHSKGRRCKVTCKKINSIRGYCVHFVGVVKEALDGRNSPRGIHEVSRTVRSCRGARRFTGSVFFCLILGENRAVGSEPTGAIRSLTYSHLGVSWVEESKPLHQDLKNRER